MKNARFSFVLLLIFCLGFISFSASAQHFVVDNGWYFRNFGTPLLTWDQYRDTFIGTPPEYSYASAALDAAFFDGVYKDQLTPPGNCYGMSLMAQLIRKKGGHLGYCYPVSQYSGSLTGSGPSDPNLHYAINIMHGHQINLNSLKQYLELFATGKTRNGSYAYQQAEYYEICDDPTIVSITKGLNPVDGGHTMAVYATQDYGSEKRIYLYDPNRSWYDSTGNAWYRNGENYIKIDPSTDEWSFVMAGGTTWSGSPTSGGNCIITPISIAGPRDRSPVSMGLDALSFLNQFFIYGAGNEINQISNSQGKRLFKPGTQEIDVDPNTGLLNTVPIYPSGGEPPYDFQSYVMFGNPGGELEFDIESAGNGYQFDVVGPRSILSVKAPSVKGTERFLLENPGMIEPRLSVQNALAAESLEVKFTQIVRPREEVRVFHMQNIVVPPKSNVKFSITRDQKGVKVISSTADLGYNLRIERWTPSEKQTIEMLELTVQAGQIQLIKPIDWKVLQPVTPTIEILPIVVDPIINP